METIYGAFQQFVSAHSQCGELVGDAEPLTAEGYRLWVKCGCGALFERWVSIEDAADDLIRSQMLAGEN